MNANNERPYRSKSGRYKGIITGFGKAKQCILDKESKDKLAADNLKLVLKQMPQ